GVIEAMPGMDLQSGSAGKLRAGPDAVPFRGRLGGAPVPDGIAPSADVDLDHGRADAHGRVDLTGLGGDEQRHADAGCDQLGNYGSEHSVLAGNVEAAFGGALLAPLRHQAGRVRL